MQLAISVVGAVVGGVIGFYAGGPSGAVYGAELGFALGGVAGSLLIHQNGPAPGDLRVQDSAYGKPIPWFYGVFRGAGNVIWCGQAKQHQPGKGGGPPGQTTVSLSFAVGICEGPIVGVRRIWANGKLIYDMSNPSNFQAVSGSNQMLQNFRVYVGDENQLPDPTIQAAEGVANTPPFRGLAYVVFNDLDLSAWGNYMPSLSFEVMVNASKTWIATGQRSVSSADYPAILAGGPSVVRIDPDGTSHGFLWGIWGLNNAMVAFTSTPYGLEFSLTGILNSGAGVQPARTASSDQPATILMTDGTVWSDAGAAFVYRTNITGASSAVIKNGRVFATNGTGYIYVGGQSGAVIQGNRSGYYSLLGASDHYLYVQADNGGDPTDPGWILQFDLNGNFVQRVVYTGLSYATVGYVASDTEIYLTGLSHVFRWDGTNLIDTGIPNGPVGVATALYVANDTAYFAGAGGSTAFVAEVPFQSPAAEPLSAIVADMCNRAGLSSSQYDVTSLTDQVLGYGVTNHSSPRANVAPLMSAFFFDANDTDNKLKFVKRGTQPVGTFLYADLGSSSQLGDQTNETPITEQIAQEVDLPRTLAFSYSSFGTDYQQNTQTAFKPDTNSNKDVTAQATIVLTDSDARLRAQSMLWAAWVGRKVFQFTSSLAYLQYEPGDVMNLQRADGSTVVVRITRCVFDGQGSLQWECQLEQPDIYPNGTFTAAGGRALGYTTPPLDYGGPTAFRVLDVPPLRDYDSTPGLYLAACGFADSWPGVIVDMSRDGSSYSQLQRMINPSVIGYTTNALANYQGGNTPDELSVLSVTLYHGALSSVSYSNFMLGNNAALVGGEVIFFRNATQTGANTYQLSGLLRGRAGTEFAISGHAIGESFVFLDPNALVRQPVFTSDIGSTLYYEPHLLNQFLNQAVSPTTATPQDANVKPLRPHLFRALPGSASATNDISLFWFRRARVYYSWANGTDVPMDQQTESYTLTISDNAGNVKRTVTVSAATTYVYSAANIASDGFTTGNTINFSISQHSDLGVIGFASTASIVR